MDIQKIIDWVYLAMGSVSEDILPRTVVETYVNLYATLYTDECTVAYYSVLACTKWLIANSVGTSPSSGGGSFRIREGNIEEEEKSGSVSKGTEWNDFLKAFLESPDSLPCRLPTLDPNDPESSGAQGRILIGNTSRKEYDRVRNNPDSMGSAGSVTTSSSRLGSVRFNNGRIIR